MADNVRPLKAIKVGERIRKELGDLDRLGASMRRCLLHPVIIRPDNSLIAGYRRLKAAEKLGWEVIPVRVVHDLDDALAALIAERDENTERLEFSPSEIVELGRRLEGLEKPAAKERQKEHGGTAPGKRKRNTGGKFPQVISGKSRDKVGSAVGTSGKTYEKAKAVVEAAEKDPEQFGDLKKQMDETGKVDPAYKELQGRLKVSPAVEANGVHKPADDSPKPTPGPKLPDHPNAEAAQDQRREMNKLARVLDDAVAEVERLGKLPFGHRLHWQSAIAQIKNARGTIWQGRPTHPCPYCAGSDSSCEVCKDTRWVNRSGFDQAPPEKKAALAAEGFDG
jgi:hypothetical protein